MGRFAIAGFSDPDPARVQGTLGESKEPTVLFDELPAQLTRRGLVGSPDCSERVRLARDAHQPVAVHRLPTTSHPHAFIAQRRTPTVMRNARLVVERSDAPTP